MTIEALRAEFELHRVEDRAGFARVDAGMAELHALMGQLYERFGDLMERRARATSSHNIDAQALANSIELVERQATGADLKIADEISKLHAVVAELRAELGETPDKLRGVKGSGMRAIVHRFESKRAAAVLILAGASGAGGVEVIKQIFHILGGF